MEDGSHHPEHGLSAADGQKNAHEPVHRLVAPLYVLDLFVVLHVVAEDGGGSCGSPGLSPDFLLHAEGEHTHSVAVVEDRHEVVLGVLVEVPEAERCGAVLSEPIVTALEIMVERCVYDKDGKLKIRYKPLQVVVFQADIPDAVLEFVQSRLPKEG